MVLDGVEHLHQGHTGHLREGSVALLSLIFSGNLQVSPCLAAKGGIQTEQQ